jgi:hypothetical protein
MDSIVKLVHKKTGNKKELIFSHAQEFLRIDNSYECAKNSNHQFINNELIKRPSKGGNKKSAKQKRDNKGEQVPE